MRKMTSGQGNVGVGVRNLADNTTGNLNVAVGFEALTNNTSAVSNTAIGAEAMHTNTTGDESVAVGSGAGRAATTATKNVFIGHSAGLDNTTGSSNVFLGSKAGENITSGQKNIAIGTEALGLLTDRDDNIAIGYRAVYGNASTTSQCTSVGVLSLGAEGSGLQGYGNVGFGYRSGCVMTSALNNTMIGRETGAVLTTGDINVCLGYLAGTANQPGGAITTGSNQIVIGAANATNAHIQIDWTVASDKRDKTDFTKLDLGLDFVKKLEPFTYRWDKRSKYSNKTPDGTHKEDWLDVGFKAQAVEVLEKEAGYKIADKTNLTTNLTKDGEQYGIQYSKFVPILVKAVQELSAEIEELKTQPKCKCNEEQIWQ